MHEIMHGASSVREPDPLQWATRDKQQVLRRPEEEEEEQEAEGAKKAEEGEAPRVGGCISCHGSFSRMHACPRQHG